MKNRCKHNPCCGDMYNCTPPTQDEGWTGKACKQCNGTGRRYSEDHDNEIRCQHCGGTGEEYKS